MIYSIWAKEFQELPEKVKYQMYEWLSRHGANPERMTGFTYDPEGGFWVEYIEVTGLGLAKVTEDLEPQLCSEWIHIEPGSEPMPPFLVWMTPGSDPPAYLGPAATNTKAPTIHLKDSEWGT